MTRATNGASTARPPIDVSHFAPRTPRTLEASSTRQERTASRSPADPYFSRCSRTRRAGWHRRRSRRSPLAIRAGREVFSLVDPLERLGRRYMMLADAYLESRPDFPPAAGVWRPEGPSALEVLAWYQVLAPARVFRAILCDAEARQGIRGRRTDTLRAAKVALIGLDRSASCDRTLQLSDDDPRLELMLTLVRQLLQAVEARFGGARSYSGPDSMSRRGAARAFTEVCGDSGRCWVGAEKEKARGPSFDLATQRYHWRDNWYTSGPSNPVLSY